MTKKFDEKNFSKLDSRKRKEVLPVEETVKQFELKSTDIIADIGCGIGYFTLPMSRLVSGKVYAVDISNVMLDELKKRMIDMNISNIELVNSKNNSFGIANNSVDFILMCTVLHEIDDQINFLAKAKEAMTDEGRLCVIEWKKEKKKMGPPSEHRIGMKSLIEVCKEVNLKFYKEILISDEFYGVVFIK